MIWIWMVAALGGEARAGCTDPAEAVDAARTHLLSLRDTQAAAEIKAAEEAFACGPWAQPVVLARLWLAEGALASLANKPEDAAEAFAAAARLAPGLWDAAYGPALYEQYKAAASVATTTSPGELRVSPSLGENEAWLDGRPFTPPGSVPSGLHLIQVGPPGGPALFAKMLAVPAGDALTVSTGLEDPDGGAVATTTQTATTAAGAANLGPEAAAIRRAATRDWGAIESATRFPDKQAERMLNAYVRKYGDVTVKINGKAVPVDIPQVREAQGRIDALPGARARLAESDASKKSLDKDFRSQAAAARAAEEAKTGLRGPTLRALGALTQATAGERSGEGYGGFGARVGLGVSFAFSAHLGARAELGYHGLSSAPVGSDDPALAGVDLPPVALQLGYGALAATLRTGDFELQAGPVFAFGSGHVPASVAWPAETLAENNAPGGTPASSSVRAGGAMLGATWEGLHMGPLRMGPAVEGGALSDGDRLYPWGALGLTIRWRI